jgi:2-enoyl-CoA hydratase-like protein
MPINPEIALSAELEPIEFSWSSSDVQLYHLALGAGADSMDPRELRYLIDDTPQVLPTFGNVAATFHATKPPRVQFPGIDVELSKVLHGSEQVSAPAPLPPAGSAKAITRFTDIWDKGKAAVIWSETRVTAPDGPCCGRRSGQSSPAAKAGSVVSAGLQEAGLLPPHRTGHRILSWKYPCCRSRRCCIDSVAIAIRCTRIPNSPLPQGFRSLSCMACAPTA